MGERDGIEYLLWRRELDDGEVTTLYAVRHPLPATRARVVHFPRTERLDVWCQANEVDEAIIGGFFVRDPYRPLGDLWIGGSPRSWSSSGPRAQSTSTAAAPRPWSTAGICSTAPTRRRTSLRRSHARS